MKGLGQWRSGPLSFTAFEPSEAELAQELFNCHAHLHTKDPTFVACEISEFEQLIAADGLPKQGFDGGFFNFRKVERNGEAVGYIQIETDVPRPGESWIPMFVLKPESQSQGLGSLVMASVFDQLRLPGDLKTVGLNVYAQNPYAFRFWVKNGFSHIAAVDIENHDERVFTCLSLIKTL